jgi:hypothetical protein
MFTRGFLICSLVLSGAKAWAEPVQSPGGSSSDFQTIKPLLKQYCYGCHNEQMHKGDLSLEFFVDKAAILKQPKTWETVLHHLQTKEMPPEDKPQPTEAERSQLVMWIQKEIFQCDCDRPNPGRVTVHRLNRSEYNNTIRDLLGVDFKPSDDFPADDSGYGFDNIGDALSLSPILLEKYFRAAQEVINAAVVDTPNMNGPARRYEAERFGRTSGDAKRLQNGIMGLYREVEIFTNTVINVAGDYIVRVRAYGEQAGSELPKLDLRLGDKRLATFNVSAIEEDPAIYETRLRLKKGSYKLSVAYLNNFKDPEQPFGKRDRNLFVDFVDVVGPAGLPELSESHKRLFPKPVTAATHRTQYAREIITRFATQAYRRPVTQEEGDRLLRFYELGIANGENFVASVKLALQAVLVSPNFLFRGELKDPVETRAPSRIEEFALASRLSYFLWSSMPDEKLFAEAKQGTLRKHWVSEVRRMLRDPKADALVENFSGQWLQLRQLKQSTPDSMEFPQFDEALRDAMEQETELFFSSILKEDRSILDFLAADFSYLNERLARHYGIDGVQGDEFRKVALNGSKRAGLLTQGSILTLTSNPNRTSPVKRGKWILENLLGAPPPPPPADIPPLNDKKEAGLTSTLRERLEEHRKNPACASCHARMDPIGFALEHFDAVGAWRTSEGTFPIDASGEFPTGERIDGALDLKKFLLEKRREEFVRCFAEKMLIYALGRGLEVYDRCAIDEIVKKAGKNGYRFSGFIIAITESAPFQLRRADTVAPQQN